MTWSPFTPRRWQAEALPLVLGAVRAGKRSVVAAATGSGKSVLLAEVIAELRLEHASTAVVVTAPTQRLVDQLAGTIEARCPGQVGKWYQHAHEVDAPIIVACIDSVPSLCDALDEAWRRCSLLVVDEAHRGSHAGVLVDAVERLRPEAMLGSTATPFRSSEQERIRIFDSVSYRYTPGQALRDGVIVPIEVHPWEGTGKRPLDEVCLEMIEAHAQGPGIANASSIGDAEMFVDTLRGHRFRAAAIHSKMALAAQDEVVRQLRDGEIDVLVHVAMLQEGVDFPWLRWGLLRRPVGAKTRFVQELGRLIRSHPGKDKAVILDPHDLMGTHGLAYAEALGWVDDEPTTEQEQAEAREQAHREQAVSAIRILAEHEARVDPVSGFARRLLLVLQAHGLAEAGQIQSPAWRRDPSTDRQCAALMKMRGLAGRLPDPHAGTVIELCAHAEVLTKGAASDLLEVLRCARKRWEIGEVEDDLAAVAPLPREALDDVRRGERTIGEDPRWYCAGVMDRKRWGACAWAVVHGGRTIVREARWLTSTDHVGAVELGAVGDAAEAGADVVALSTDWVARFVTRARTPKDPRMVMALRRVPRGLGVELVETKSNPAVKVAWATLHRMVRSRRTG